MVSLVDIARAAETVSIRGQEVEVTGIGAGAIAALLARFPELRRMFSGREPALDQLLAMGGEIVNAIIAAGTGAAGDRDAEAAADGLNVEEQLALLEAILRATLPNGIGPFMDKLMALGAVVGVDERSLDAAASAVAPRQKSPRPSKSSSPGAIPPAMSGATRRGN